MREQEIADEEAAKKKKEWEKEWEVSSFEERLNISIELVLGAFSSGGVVKAKLVNTSFFGIVTLKKRPEDLGTYQNTMYEKSPWRHSHIKRWGLLDVSFSINHGFWSHLGCS